MWPIPPFKFKIQLHHYSHLPHFSYSLLSTVNFFLTWETLLLYEERKKKKFYLVFPIYELKQVTLLLSQFFILKENIPQTNIALNNMTELQKILGTKINETNHPCSAKFDTGLNTFLPYYLYYFLV